MSRPESSVSGTKAEMTDRSVGAEIYEYIDDTHLYMAAADLIICHAERLPAPGAAVGVPSIMIPYPYAAETIRHTMQRNSRKRVRALHTDSELSAELLREKRKNSLKIAVMDRIWVETPPNFISPAPTQKLHKSSWTFAKIVIV